MTKGIALRAWQREAVDTYFQHERTDFQLTATPGAGKTTFALVVATRLIQAGRVEQIVIVAPTDHLRQQWAQSAGALGITLDPSLGNSTSTMRRGVMGYVTTYAQVAALAGRHQARTSSRATLVILDEIHHAGDGLSWGDAIQVAFSDVTARLALSGTPFRTKPGERIPFVNYRDDGDELVSVADFTYSYRDALRDGVVRPVVFAAYGGESRWIDSHGLEITAALSADVSAPRQDIERAWRTALNPNGQWVPHVIAAMHDRVIAQRKSGIPDAAGLILASDQDAARAYARIVDQVTGQQPVLVLSDDPTASSKIERFRSSDDLYAVCVRMISEGVDIPRATAICYLTSYQTPLFFTQAVGRVVRARNRRELATVFLPAVPSLLSLAAEIEEQRNHIIKVSNDDVAAVDDYGRPESTEPVEEWLPLSAQARFAHVVHSGKAVVAADSPSEGDLDFLGLPGLLTPEQTAAVLARRDKELRRSTPAKGADTHDAGIESGDISTLRKTLSSAVAAVAASTGEPHARIHLWTREQVAGPPSSAADAAIIELRIDALRSRLVRTQRTRTPG